MDPWKPIEDRLRARKAAWCDRMGILRAGYTPTPGGGGNRGECGVCGCSATPVHILQTSDNRFLPICQKHLEQEQRDRALYGHSCLEVRF